MLARPKRTLALAAASAGQGRPGDLLPYLAARDWSAATGTPVTGYTNSLLHLSIPLVMQGGEIIADNTSQAIVSVKE